MIKEAIEKVNALAVPNYKELDGKTYCDKTMTEIKPKQGPDPKNLPIKTLSGVVDYIKNKLDDEPDYLVHIEDYNSVTLYGKYDPEFCRRKMYVNADSQLQRFQYGRFMDVEDFIINILSYFSPNETLSNLFAYIGSLSDDTTVDLADDGVSQTAIVKTSITNKANKTVPNPVELIPYETFPDVDGVARKFVFRLKKTSTGVACALFESGDTSRKLEYIKRIREYFEQKFFITASDVEALKVSIIA